MTITSRAPEPDWAAVATVLGTCLMEVRDATVILLNAVANVNGTLVLPGQPVQIDPNVQTKLIDTLVKLQDHAATGIQKAADILVNSRMDALRASPRAVNSASGIKGGQP